MTAVRRLVAFAAVLVLAFGAAAAVGAAVGPIDVGDPTRTYPAHTSPSTSTHPDGH